jgi:hypothetical protein
MIARVSACFSDNFLLDAGASDRGRLQHLCHAQGRLSPSVGFGGARELIVVLAS